MIKGEGEGKEKEGGGGEESVEEAQAVIAEQRVFAFGLNGRGTMDRHKNNVVLSLVKESLCSLPSKTLFGKRRACNRERAEGGGFGCNLTNKEVQGTTRGFPTPFLCCLHLWMIQE